MTSVLSDASIADTIRVSHHDCQDVTIKCRRRLCRKSTFPSLAKEGWMRPLRKCREAALAGAGGREAQARQRAALRVVGSSHRLIGSRTNHPVRASIRKVYTRPEARPLTRISRAVSFESLPTNPVDQFRGEGSYWAPEPPLRRVGRYRSFPESRTRLN
jgi:hypothetical protein